MRIVLAPTLFTTLALLATPGVAATNHTIVVGGGAGLVYTPSALTVQAGDSVTFTNKPADGGGGFHNVDSYGDSVTTFRCSNDCADNSGPSSNAWSQTLTFGTPGTVKYHCDQHGGITGTGAAATCAGMCGTITVQAVVPVVLQSFDVD